MSYTEAHFENAVVELMRERLGYCYLYGPDMDRDLHNPLYEPILIESLERINPLLGAAAIGEAIVKLKMKA